MKAGLKALQMHKHLAWAEWGVGSPVLATSGVFSLSLAVQEGYAAACAGARAALGPAGVPDQRSEGQGAQAQRHPQPQRLLCTVPHVSQLLCVAGQAAIEIWVAPLLPDSICQDLPGGDDHGAIIRPSRCVLQVRCSI